MAMPLQFDVSLHKLHKLHDPLAPCIRMCDMPKQEYVVIARELYAMVIKLMQTTSDLEATKTVLDKHCQCLALARSCFQSSLGEGDMLAYSKKNPRVPEAYHLIHRWPGTHMMGDVEFHKDAISSDDGLRWHRVSRVGEPGRDTLVAEPDN